MTVNLEVKILKAPYTLNEDTYQPYKFLRSLTTYEAPLSQAAEDANAFVLFSVFFPLHNDDSKTKVMKLNFTAVKFGSYGQKAILFQAFVRAVHFPPSFNPSYVYGMFYKVSHYTNGPKCRGHCALASNFLCLYMFKSQFQNGISAA